MADVRAGYSYSLNALLRSRILRMSLVSSMTLGIQPYDRRDDSSRLLTYFDTTLSVTGFSVVWGW